MKLHMTVLAIGLAAIAVAAIGAPADYSEPDRIYAALADQPHETLTIGGSEIDLVFADGAPGLDRTLTKAWVLASAKAVTTYFGRFPVKHLGLLVIADDGATVGHGTTYGYAGSAIRMHVGREAGAAAFSRDWVLVHEMTHLALPDIPRRSWWLLEGSATYIEPIARVQAGQLEPAAIWREMVRDMPKGQPAPGDHGLDHTPTWGRTYWGGALFLLQADVEIRRQTRNRKGLQDALRAINRASGGNSVRWTMEQLAATGDAATGTHVLANQYAVAKASPAPVDLGALFANLGIVAGDGTITFDDAAPLAAIRRAITAVPDPAN